MVALVEVHAVRDLPELPVDAVGMLPAQGSKGAEGHEVEVAMENLDGHLSSLGIQVEMDHHFDVKWKPRIEIQGADNRVDWGIARRSLTPDSPVEPRPNCLSGFPLRRRASIGNVR
jgi:hypothetical protein